MATRARAIACDAGAHDEPPEVVRSRDRATDFSAQGEGGDPLFFCDLEVADAIGHLGDRRSRRVAERDLCSLNGDGDVGRGEYRPTNRKNGTIPLIVSVSYDARLSGAMELAREDAGSFAS